jgi:hypothetical protein
MSRRLVAALIVPALMAAHVPAARAGQRVRIQTQAGNLIEGELVDTLPDAYLVRIASGRSIKVPFSEVARIDKAREQFTAPPAEKVAPGVWAIEERQETITSYEASGGPSVGIGLGFGTAIGAGSSVGASVGVGGGGGGVSARTAMRRLLVVREGGQRDVPAREIIEKSGAADLMKNYKDARDEIRGERVLAHVGYGLLEGVGIAATIVGAVLLAGAGDKPTENERYTRYAIGGFVTVVGVSITIDTPFRWYRRGKELNWQLEALDRTPYAEAFMKPDRLRDEVARHNQSIR